MTHESRHGNFIRRLEALTTSPLTGMPIFLAVMATVFWATFSLGSYPMEWIDAGVEWLGDFVRRVMPQGALRDLISDGIIGGVGGVIVFLPNILILYFCITFMEESGYMTRAAKMMDAPMRRLGINGRSFIPLIMGFGCNVPAIMSTKNIKSRSSRFITILINPFMSCSARLPVYVLLIGTFFPDHATLAFMTLYLIGVLVAIVTALLLRHLWFKGEDETFEIELPAYRMPGLKATLRGMWATAAEYLHKMSGVILVASIIMWALNYFPLHDEDSSVPAAEQAELKAKGGESYLAMIGKAVNPVMEPLGFPWRATVAAIAGISAKEITVSTLGVLYTGDEEATDNTLSARITAPNPVTGEPDFTTASAWSFMIFILLYFPCVATVTAIVKQTGHWGYGLFSVCYNTTVAWLMAFIAYQLLS